MGLDFNHCDAHWAYGGFSRFRKRLAQSIGINLDDMQGYGGNLSWDKIIDPIKDFLYHSDCDGELTPKQCQVVAPRLRELIAGWPDDDYDKKQAEELINGMEEAIISDEPLEFM